MYYFEHGAETWGRPAVILLHGAGGNHLSWPPETRRLPGQRLYALDLPGHGKSDGIGRQSIADYARCVLDFMDALKIRKAVFIGHSMGGAIALSLGLHHPSRTLGLGLLGTAPRLRVSAELLTNSATQAAFPLAVKTLVDWSFGPQADPRTRELAAQRLSEIRYSVLNGDLLACDAYDEANLLGRIKAPSLVICGSEDRMVPSYTSRAMQARLKNSLLQVIDGAGHNVMLEQPLAVAKLLHLFLETIVYQPGEAG